jgi:two-component system, OmpR family, sensor histidine kinase MprB
VTLRLRIAAVASLAVAVAVLAAAVSVYLAVRSDLRGQIDESLTQRAQVFVSEPSGPAPSGVPRAGFPSGARPDGVPPPAIGGEKSGHDRFPSAVQPGRFGAATGYVQFISAQGTIDVPGGQGSSPSIAPSASDKAIAERGRGRALSDRTVKGTHLRVLTIGSDRLGIGGTAAGGGGQGAVLIARPLTEVDREMSRVLAILAIVGIAGIAIAAALGAIVARAALAPIARFTRRTETLAGDLNLSERLPEEGRDELARLASSFNATLDALERSVIAQRNLVADASHELRTPIASLRANIQVLADADRLPPGDQASLRADIVSELDELTRLVGDVVELARGTDGKGVREEVRLDEIVRGAIQRAERRASARFDLRLEPTVLRGEADRIDRAVANLLDNACKWSPAEESIEVGLNDGMLTVRDHGPGFEEADLPHVFERFYRADRARKQPGSGLGLAIVRQAAEAHGGRVEARNAPGGGALVRVSFGAPVAPVLPASSRAGEPERPVLR